MSLDRRGQTLRQKHVLLHRAGERLRIVKQRGHIIQSLETLRLALRQLLEGAALAQARGVDCFSELLRGGGAAGVDGGGARRRGGRWRGCRRRRRRPHLRDARVAVPDLRLEAPQVLPEFRGLVSGGIADDGQMHIQRQSVPTVLPGAPEVGLERTQV